MMTESDKKEIAAIVSTATAAAVREAMTEQGHCALGIKPETAHELISFADAWKTGRRTAVKAGITVIIGGALLALWSGIRMLVK